MVQALGYYYQDPTLYYNDNAGPFPIIPDGFTYLGSNFFPAYFSAPEGDYDYAEIGWKTVDLLHTNNFNSISDELNNQITTHDGTLLATRWFHREIFNVTVPLTYTLPDFLPFGVGGTHDVPVFGGQTLVSMNQYRMQVLYHNFIVVAVLVALAIVAIIGSVVVLDHVTHDKYHLTASLFGLLNNLTPGEVGKQVASVFILMAVAFAIAAVVLPKIQQPNIGIGARAGPVNITAGNAQAPRR